MLELVQEIEGYGDQMGSVDGKVAGGGSGGGWACWRERQSGGAAAAPDGGAAGGPRGRGDPGAGEDWGAGGAVVVGGEFGGREAAEGSGRRAAGVVDCAAEGAGAG